MEQSLQRQNEAPLSVHDMKVQIQTIQHMLKEVMKPNVHYGKIPGCGDKPTLLKAGAEKISMTFRLAPTYDFETIDLEDEHREVEVKCTLTHIPTGQVFGQGLGSCSTMEGKYRYRKAARKCPSCQAEAIIYNKFGKGEYKDGWLCWLKKNGCGAEYEKREPKIINQDFGEIENDNPADQYNTVLKMAKKRAHVDAVLTATAASDCFTQDIEDMPEVIDGAKDFKEQKEDKKTKGAKPKLISDEQRQNLFDLVVDHDWPESAVRSMLASYGFDNSKDITDDKLEAILKEVEGGYQQTLI